MTRSRRSRWRITRTWIEHREDEETEEDEEDRGWYVSESVAWWKIESSRTRNVLEAVEILEKQLIISKYFI